jgi:electron transfer flavoprotein beta subunit
MMKNHEIDMVSLKHLKDQNPDHYGLSGSPTQVDEIFPPQKRTETLKVKGSSKELAESFFNILKESRYV